MQQADADCRIRQPVDDDHAARVTIQGIRVERNHAIGGDGADADFVQPERTFAAKWSRVFTST